jgi:hypothetical protein
LESIDEINEAERRLGLTLGSIVMMDRFLMDQRDPDIWRFLVRYYELLKGFMLRHRVDMALGEPTNANDIMTFFVASVLGVPYRHISSVRIPSTRSALFAGYREDAIVEHGNLGEGPESFDAGLVISGVTERREKPVWYAKNNRRGILQLKDFWGLVRNVYWHLSDPRRSLTSFRIGSRITDRLSRLAKRHYVKRWLRIADLSDVPRPFALYALQVQPERGVDVIGRFASNQLEVIRNIRRGLPAQYALVVKEHSNLLGGRGREFFRAVQGLPNTYVCSPFMDSHVLIREAALVFSVTGTILYEAALAGRPSVSLTEMFFNRLPLSFCCPDPRDIGTVIERALAAHHDSDADAAFIRWLLQNSVEGMVGDAVRDTGLTAPANVRALVRLVASALADSFDPSSNAGRRPERRAAAETGTP